MPTSSHQQIQERLQTFACLEGLDRAAFSALAAHIKLEMYATGEILFWEGEPSAGLFIVESGWLKAVKISPEGREQVIRFFKPGEMFNEVITCDSHSAWVSMNVDPPENDGNDEGDDTFVLSFSDCSIKDDHTFEDYLAATEQWNEYAAEHGFKQAGWVWFPVAGESDDDYDFKFAGGEDDYRTMGANWQLYMDGHWQKSNEIFDDIVKCDVSRIYNATMIRRWADED